MLEKLLKKQKLSRYLIVIALFIFSLTTYFKFAIPNLDKFFTADEHLWTIGGGYPLINEYSESKKGRIEKYWTAMGGEDWEATRVNDKPGVSLAYTSGLGYLFGDIPEKIIKEKGGTFINYDTEAISKTLINFRLPLVIFTALMSVFFLIYFWRLFKNEWIALFSSSLILLSPILLGISQIVNPDTMFWPTAFASILAFFAFLRYGRFVDIFVAGIFFGFALLSKYVALILIPFYLIMALIFLFFEYENLEKQNILVRRMRQIFIGYPFVIAAGIGLFSLLMPALLVKEGLLYESTLGFKTFGAKLIYLAYAEIFFLIDSLILRGFITRFVMRWLRFLRFILPRLLYLFLFIVFSIIFINFAHLENYLGAGKEAVFNLKDINMELFLKGIIPQMSPLIFSLIPITLFLMLFFWIKSVFKRSIFDYIAFPLSLFIVIYYYAMYAQSVSLNPRYSIILFPIAITIAALGFYEIINIFRIKKYALLMTVLSALIIFQSGLILKKSRPFYFNYASEFFPSEYSFSKGWGYGGYEASELINSWSKSDSYPVVWDDYYGFCPFFKGKCLFQNAPYWIKKNSIESIDYFIVSSQGQEKNRPSLRKVMKAHPGSWLVGKIEIGERFENYIHIYKTEKQKINQPPIFDIYPPISKLDDSKKELRAYLLKRNNEGMPICGI